jgi:hydroxypyruvate isomerase
VIRFAAHLEMNFASETPFEERWKGAHQAGLGGCEFVWRVRELTDVLTMKEAYPMEVACLGGTSGFAAGGGRPVLTRPEDRAWLIRDVRQAIDYAKAASCPQLVFVPGNLQPDLSSLEHRREAVRSFAAIAPMLEEAGIVALLEPLNSKVDHKGIYCDTSAEAFRIVEQVGSTHVKVLYDVYHMQVMEGNLIDTIRQCHSMIGHYHIARVPGRNEPIGGEINVPAVIEAIAATGYSGFIGLEYKPSAAALDVYRELRDTYRI